MTSSADSPLDIRLVVTCFLTKDGKILVMKRSQKVGTMRGKWSGISGYLEGDETPMERGLKEIAEETGLSKDDVTLIRSGKIVIAPDTTQNNLVWVVNPLLLDCKSQTVQLNWENDEYRWISPEELESLDAVPMLKETLNTLLQKPTPLDIPQEVMQVLQTIKEDRKKGAVALTNLALDAVELHAEKSPAPDDETFRKKSLVFIHELSESRPSMAPLTNSMMSIYFGLRRRGQQSASDLRSYQKSRVAGLRHQLSLAMTRAALQASGTFPKEGIVLTHSFSATVFEAFRWAQTQGKWIKAVVTESRPLYEGRTMASYLLELRLPVTLVVDSAVGLAVRDASMVLTGADSVLADGSIVNKVGTYPLALAAKDAGIPFYAVAEKMKFDLMSFFGQPPVLEEKEPQEVLENPKGFEVRNLYFDVTPARLISGIATEDGLVDSQKLPEEFEKLINELYFA